MQLGAGKTVTGAYKVW